MKIAQNIKKEGDCSQFYLMKYMEQNVSAFYVDKLASLYKKNIWTQELICEVINLDEGNAEVKSTTTTLNSRGF